MISRFLSLFHAWRTKRALDRKAKARARIARQWAKAGLLLRADKQSITVQAKAAQLAAEIGWQGRGA